MDQTNIRKIKKVVQEFFENTGLAITTEVKNPVDSTIPVNLTASEPQTLIGERGQNLAEIQRLLKVILKKQIVFEGPFYVDLDINEYKKKKVEYLKELAKTTADEVVLAKKEKDLPPMPPYERRVVHIELASRNDIATESIGQGPERKVVIRPYP